VPLPVHESRTSAGGVDEDADEIWRGMMRENVGGWDRGARAVAGPALLALGYTRLGGGRGAAAGLLAMLAGALITETAITRVCPLNEALNVDTARRLRFG
jgi:Protein of unknown function (DUF2892)